MRYEICDMRSARVSWHVELGRSADLYISDRPQKKSISTRTIYSPVLGVINLGVELIAEASQNLRIACAVWSQPHSGSCLQRTPGGHVIASFSYAQLLGITAISIVPRFIVSLLLGLIGVVYLGTTRSVHELILNTVALGFILEIDNLLYASIPFGMGGPKRFH